MIQRNMLNLYTIDLGLLVVVYNWLRFACCCILLN